MAENRKVKAQYYKANTNFPAIDHLGNSIMSERRGRPSRRVYDVYTEDIDLPTMFLDINKQM
jgi:hypothetical protein